MNRGDTSYLMLNYTINGDPLVEGDYEEIELTINEQSSFRSVKKLLSKGEIEWGTLTYIEDELQNGVITPVQKTFTGYFAHLSQEETFLLQQGGNEVQLRILDNNEVGSSAISTIMLGQTLSSEVLTDGNHS